MKINIARFISWILIFVIITLFGAYAIFVNHAAIITVGIMCFLFVVIGSCAFLSDETLDDQ